MGRYTSSRLTPSAPLAPSVLFPRSPTMSASPTTRCTPHFWKMPERGNQPTKSWITIGTIFLKQLLDRNCSEILFVLFVYLNYIWQSMKLPKTSPSRAWLRLNAFLVLACFLACLLACLLASFLPAYLPACLPAFLPAYLPAYLPYCLLACLLACLPACLLACNCSS